MAEKHEGRAIPAARPSDYRISATRIADEAAVAASEMAAGFTERHAVKLEAHRG